jgi:uncharacterized protein (DUF1800 family)
MIGRFAPRLAALALLLALSASLQAQSAGALYIANLRPEAGAVNSTASGTATLMLSPDGSTATVDILFSGLSSEETEAHLKVGSATGGNNIVVDYSSGQVIDKSWSFTPTGNFSTAAIQAALTSGNLYVEVDTTDYPSGELAGQFIFGSGSQTFTPPPAPTPVNLSTISQVDAARFLTQATFGPTMNDIGLLMQQGYNQWIASQMALPETSHLAGTRADAASYPNTGSFPIVQKNREAAWWNISVNAPDQLRQRVAFALSEIFVVSDVASSLTNQPEALANYYDMLANDAFGNFRQLIQDVTLSPVMGNYLDMLRSTPANPTLGTAADENYARESMQLFTIGLNELNPDGSLQLDSTGQPIPTYTQTTIVQTANLLTGWAYYNTAKNPSFSGSAADWYDQMMLYPAFHDNTQKTIVNNVNVPANEGGAADLKIYLDTLFNHQNTGPFLARGLIERLVNSNPSPGYIYRVAQVFANNGSGVRGDLSAVIKAILLDPEARSTTLLANAGYGKLKEPILRQTALYRAFAVSTPRFTLFNSNNTLGQTPLDSPTVFNFFLPDYVQPGSLASAGLVAPEFQITTATTALTVANNLYSSVYATTGTVLNLSLLTAEASNPSAMVATANLLICGGNMTAATQQYILSGLAALPASTSAEQKASFVLELAVTSPDGAIQE